jgi:hypothetical protein
MIGALAMILAAASPRAVGPLVTLGRASLPVYWFHLTYAYSQLSQPFKKQLSLGTATAVILVVIVAMYIVALIRLGPYERLTTWLAKKLSRRVDAGPRRG